MNNITDAAKALIAEINEDTETYPVAALKQYFENNPAWGELVENDLVNCWVCDTGVEYVEIGSQL